MVRRQVAERFLIQCKFLCFWFVFHRSFFLRLRFATANQPATRLGGVNGLRACLALSLGQPRRSELRFSSVQPNPTCASPAHLNLGGAKGRRSNCRLSESSAAKVLGLEDVRD